MHCLWKVCALGDDMCLTMCSYISLVSSDALELLSLLLVCRVRSFWYWCLLRMTMFLKSLKARKLAVPPSTLGASDKSLSL
jgi:hypothetical protein